MQQQVASVFSHVSQNIAQVASVDSTLQANLVAATLSPQVPLFAALRSVSIAVIAHCSGSAISLRTDLSQSLLSRIVQIFGAFL